MRIRVSPQSRADLDELWLHIARESGSEKQATRVVNAITDKFALFARFPFIGKSFDSTKRPNIRSFPVYSTPPGEIRVLRIIHTSRDAGAVFTEQ
jgi:plasmid stabilization system protein ParE